jgi:hypothetical protein
MLSQTKTAVKQPNYLLKVAPDIAIWATTIPDNPYVDICTLKSLYQKDIQAQKNV